MSDVGTEKAVCAACGADMVCSEHGLSLPCDMCEAEGSATSMLCGKCGKTEAREAEFDPLICHACGKVYLHGDDDGLCDDPMCGGAHLEPLLGFISYRRTYTSHRDPQEKNEVAIRIKERVEKVLHSQKVQGGFFIDKSGIEREDFAKKITSTIRACKGRVFLLILTPGALDPRDHDDEDWMLNEIRLAIQHGMEIIPVKASNFRKDEDFRFPAKLPEKIRQIQKMNVNLSYIGDLEEHSINDAIIRITNEVRRALDRISEPSVSKARHEAIDRKPVQKTSSSPQRKNTSEGVAATEQFNPVVVLGKVKRITQIASATVSMKIGASIMAIAAFSMWISNPGTVRIWATLSFFLGLWFTGLAYLISKKWSWLLSFFVSLLVAFLAAIAILGVFSKLLK